MKRKAWTHSATFVGHTTENDYLRAVGECNAARKDREKEVGKRLKLHEVEVTDADQSGRRKVEMTYLMDDAS